MSHRSGEELVDRARAGDARAVARLISLVENASPALREVMAGLMPHVGHAWVIGLTGSPGVGKSTSTSVLVSAFRAAGKRVGVLAVDPSSPFSGGALLGDRLTLELLVGVSASSPRGHSSGTIAKRLNWQDDTRASLPRSAPGSKPTTGALQRLAYRSPAAASG